MSKIFFLILIESVLFHRKRNIRSERFHQWNDAWKKKKWILTEWVQKNRIVRILFYVKHCTWTIIIIIFSFFHFFFAEKLVAQLQADYITIDLHNTFTNHKEKCSTKRKSKFTSISFHFSQISCFDLCWMFMFDCLYTPMHMNVSSCVSIHTKTISFLNDLRCLSLNQRQLLLSSDLL